MSKNIYNLDGTWTEEGKRRRAKGLYNEIRKTASNQAKRNSGWRDAVYENATGHLQGEVTGIINSEAYIDARSKLDHAGKLGSTFFNNKGLENEYLELAGIVDYLRQRQENGESIDIDRDHIYIQDLIANYKYGDYDQGDGNSFQLYAIDKGVNALEYDQNLEKAISEFNDSMSSIVQERLGSYAGMPVPRKYSYKNTAGEYLIDLAEDLDTWFASKQFIDLGPKEASRYRQLLEQAKSIKKELSSKKQYKTWYDVSKEEKNGYLEKARKTGEYSTDFADLFNDWKIPKDDKLKLYKEYMDNPVKFESYQYFEEVVSKYPHL